MEATERPHVGVVGDDALADAVRAADATTTDGEAAAVLSADPDWVVAGGDPALLDLVAAEVDVPVLAVGADGALPTVERERVGDAVSAVAAGEWSTTTRALYDVVVGGDVAGTALRDVTLVTGEPARISEYTVRSGDGTVARFRADGVVAATPAGSAGYLGDAGGPLLEPGIGALGVVPVAPFQTDSDHWVLDDGGVSLTVRRDQPVVLVVDGVERRQVPRDEPVELVPAGELTLLAGGGDWKNSNGRRSQ